MWVLGFVCEFGGEWRGDFEKKKKVEETEDIWRRGFGGLIFLQNIKLSSFEEIKKIIFEEGFRGFGRVYINSSNLIFIVIIFLKLNIYYS